ncbi:serine protease inhibitor Cvsi-2-like [Ostrea edulis]|uniref:serine protease inhibitor Cvsi-2-like n=1 Tax=Ostrea edulis TaxID=37623 RepID=UPI00209450EC|nr:serine protease inhibitor Cvsi-2-like [Ostrea edulis]
MKAAVFVFLAVAIVYVLSERCNVLSNCADTICSGNASHVECEHHQCTCIANPMSCSDRNDCHMSDSRRCPDKHEEFHCLDGMCTCLDLH